MANIYDTALVFKKQLEKMDEATLKLITAEYDRTLAKLKNQFIAMSKRANEYSLEHPAPTPYELGRLKEIKQAIEDVEARVSELHGKAADTISMCQEAYTYAVPAHYEELVNGLADEYGAEDVHFSKVNHKAFEQMVGFTSDGSPLVDVLNKHAGLNKDNIISILRHGVLVGENPEATARKMTKAGHDDLGHALLVARTESMRVAQEVGNKNFEDNGIEYVQWVSGETPYTCAACWAMSGKVYEVGKQPHDHPNGRCVFNPYIPALAELDPDLYKHDPEENFAKLSEEEQLEILGPQRLEMYKKGELKLEDLVSTVNNKDYGESIRIASLKDLKAGDGGVKSIVPGEVPKDSGLADPGDKSSGAKAEAPGKPADSTIKGVKLDKTPAESYNIDRQFHEQFNSMTKDMQELFAPYLKEGKVDADFDDSKVDEEIKKAKGYHSPLALAVKMQSYVQSYYDSNQDAAEDYAIMHKFSSKIAINKNGDVLPLYKIAKKAFSQKDKLSHESRFLLKQWESSSHCRESTWAREASGVLFGGTVYNEGNIEMRPREVIEKMFLLQDIYNKSRKDVNKLAKGDKIHLLRAVAGENFGNDNSLVSWTLDKPHKDNPGYNNFAEYWKDYLEDEAKKKKENITAQILEGDFDPDCILTVYGIMPGLEIEKQFEHIILGGLL